MLASDRTIRWMLAQGHLKVDPAPSDNLIQPASLDVHLDRFFRIINQSVGIIDPSTAQDLTTAIEVRPDEAFVLKPGEFVLGSLVERIRLSSSVAAQVDGRSSMGRLGLFVHCTAGWIDPGFEGHVTLELLNAAPLPVLLWPGMKIAQLVFSGLHEAAERPYGHNSRNSSYNHQTRGPKASASWNNWNPIPT